MDLKPAKNQAILSSCYLFLHFGHTDTEKVIFLLLEFWIHFEQ